LQAAQHWLAQGHPIAMATVIETWGSAAVPVGGQMAILSEDAFQGSVSGGCVEADVITAALDVIATGESQTLSFGVSDAMAWRAGLACGGKIKILVSTFNPTRDRHVLEFVSAGRLQRKATVVELPLGAGAPRAHSVNERAAIPVDAQDALDRGVSCIAARAEGDVFLHLITPSPRIVIVGATHIAQVLSSIARTIDYDVLVLDPRSAFASDVRFGDVAVITEWPSSGLAPLIDDAYTAVVALTHANAIDDEALTIALKAPVRYIGALGSRKTHEKRIERLRAAGFSDGDIQRIKAPIGLDIGAKSAGEIATAILAQVVAAFRSGRVA
jgi:xanthine dehydrogenase accessory factor